MQRNNGGVKRLLLIAYWPYTANSEKRSPPKTAIRFFLAVMSMTVCPAADVGWVKLKSISGD
jgi:hypothetical protein